MNIKQIEEALKNEDTSPPDLAKFGTILSGYYSFYGQMLKRIQLKKPEKWLHIQDWQDPHPGSDEYVRREKPLSDKKTERTWEATEDGQREIALEWELKRIEKMISSINKRLYVDSVAARNQY